MYKDKDKQREANRRAQRRFKAKQGITEKRVLSRGITLSRDVLEAIDRVSDSPEEKVRRTAIAENYAKLYPDRCKVADAQYTDHEFALIMAGAGRTELRRVSKPGDPDYKPSGITETCKECGQPLPQLEQPRQADGACFDCVKAIFA